MKEALIPNHVEQWIEELRKVRKENTVLAYASDLQLVAHQLGDRILRAATPEEMLAAVESLKARKLSDSSIKRLVASVRSYLQFLSRQGLAEDEVLGRLADRLNAVSKKCAEGNRKERTRIRRKENFRSRFSQLNDVDFLKTRYLEETKTTRQIADEVGCSHVSVVRALECHNIPIRNRSEACRSSELRTTLLADEDVFARWTPEIAWVLGLLFTDGTLSNGSVHFAQKDREIVDKVASVIQYEGEPRYSPSRVSRNGVIAGEVFTISFMSRRAWNDLVRIGLGPRKSLVLRFPKVPEPHLRHFLRGCWDGDGSVYIESRGKSIRASFVSGSREFIEGVRQSLVENGIAVSSVYSENRSKHPSFMIRCSKSGCLALYSFLYQGVDEKYYLSRKRRVFEEYFGVPPEQA